MNKIDFKNLPDTSTPLSAENLNAIQTNVEDVFNGNEVAGGMVVDSIRTKNIFGNYTILNAWISGTLLRVDINTGNRAAFIKCKPNTTYTITRSVITSTFRVSDYTTIPAQTSGSTDYTIPTAIENNSGTKITYTTSSTAQYLIVHYGNLTNDTADLILNSLNSIQVEEGNTATTFSPYQNLNLEIKNKYVYGTPDSNGFLPTGIDIHNIIIGVAGISINAGFFIPFIEKNANRLTIKCETWNRTPITTSVSFTIYYIEI